MRGLVLCILLSCALALDSRWKLVWSDEFNGNTLDTSKWNAIDAAGLADNGELQWYLPSQVSVEGGSLVLTSDRASHNGFDYISGEVDSRGKFSTMYGRWEINAKLAGGYGMWPAHWMISESLCWPAGIEIDIMEALGRDPYTVYETVHFGSYCGNNNGNGSAVSLPYDWTQDFHVYALEWSATGMSWFVDNLLTKTVSNTDVFNGQPFTFDYTPHYMILNTALGGDWAKAPLPSTVFPSKHYIDYVRFYGWEPCAGAGCVHGCCDAASQTCKCDAGWQGVHCDFTISPATRDDFDSANGNDNPSSGNNGYTQYLPSNIAYNGKADLTMQYCSTCNGLPVSSAYWATAANYGSGTYEISLQVSNVGSAPTLLWLSGGNPWEALQIDLGGSNPTQVYAQVWAGGWNGAILSGGLGFDASNGYHKYTIVYKQGQSIAIYADGALLVNFVDHVPVAAFGMGVEFTANSAWWGTPSLSTPAHTYIDYWSYTPFSEKAVCAAPTLPPTPVPPTPKPPTPVPATKAPTPAPIPSNVVCAGPVAEGATVSLSCPANHVITSVQFASYGTPTGSCGNFALGHCHAQTSLTVAQSACLNQNSCSFVSGNGVFGDPCSGTVKHYNIQVVCGAPPCSHPSVQTFVRDFNAYDAANDVLSDSTDGPTQLLSSNAVMNGVLSLTATDVGCPAGCSGQAYSGATWASVNTYGAGTFVFRLKSHSASGAALNLWLSSRVGTWEAIQLSIGGVNPRSLGVQVWAVGGGGYWSYPLSFDASAGFHTYTVVYVPGGASTIYADGVAIATISVSPISQLGFSTEFIINTGWYGAWTSGHALVQIDDVSWSTSCPSTAGAYIGCYADADTRDFKVQQANGLSIQQCRDLCGSQGYAFTALQYGQECRCGTTYDLFGKASESDCNMPCQADGSAYCGGGWRNSVFASSV